MRETIESPENYIGGRPEAIDQAVLEETVAELLGEKDRDQSQLLTEAFFWRAIFLYKEKTGARPEPDMAKEFYEQLRKGTAEILKRRARRHKAKINYSDVKTAASRELPNWLKEETEREDRNERRP